MRDVAYGQIPRADRAAKHLRAAEWIESLGRPEDHAEMLAHHYVNALELARAAGEETDELRERTVRALRDAGDRALALNALAQAHSYFRQARALAPDDVELLLRYARVLYLQDEQGEEELKEARKQLLATRRRETAAEATLLLADIAWKHGRRKDMETYLEEAGSYVAGESASRAQAAVLTERARFEMVAGRMDAALDLGLQALAMAEELELDDLRLRVLNTVGVAHGVLGDPAGLAELEEVIELASQSNAVLELLRGWNNRTALTRSPQHYQKTREGEDETLRLGRHYGNRGFVRFIEGGASIGNRYHTGEWEDSFARAEKADRRPRARSACTTGPVRLSRSGASSGLPATTRKAPRRMRTRPSSARGRSATRRQSIPTCDGGADLRVGRQPAARRRDGDRGARQPPSAASISVLASWSRRC